MNASLVYLMSTLTPSSHRIQDNVLHRGTLRATILDDSLILSLIRCLPSFYQLGMAVIMVYPA